MLTGAFIWSQMERFADPNSDVHLTGGGPSRGSRDKGSSFNEAFQNKVKFISQENKSVAIGTAVVSGVGTAAIRDSVIKSSPAF